MGIPYIQSTMQEVRVVDGSFISYPFIDSGDTSTKVYSLICSQLASYYNTSQIDLDTPLSDAASAGVIDLPTGWADNKAYFVGDTNHQSNVGGMLSFTRTFANIPKTTLLASGSQSYTFPGIVGSRGELSPRNIASLSMTVGTIGVTLTTSGFHDLDEGDNVNITMDYTVGTDPFIHSINGNFRVLEVPSLTTLRLDVGHYWGEQVTLSINSGSIIEGSIVRAPTAKNVSTLTRYDYILPGVTLGINNVLDINVTPEFSAIENITGEQAQTVTDVGTTTIPSATEYRAMIAQEKNIVIESSLSVWAGNILVLTTKTCKAK